MQVEHEIAEAREPHERFALRAELSRRAASFPRRPRVISAMRVFAPKPMPSERPAPTASTFFTAPPTSTPTMSVDVYARKLFEDSPCASGRGELRVRRGNGHRRRQTLAHFPRERRAGQHGRGTLGAQHFTRHLMRQLAGVELESLCRLRDARRRLEQRRDFTRATSETNDSARRRARRARPLALR